MKIVYCSNAGHTKQYAQMLGKKLNMDVVPYNKINFDDEIIYMGWVFGNNIMGLNKINNSLKCVVAVGMNKPSKAIIETIRNTSKVSVPLFYLHGGVDYKKLKGFYKFIFKLVMNKIVKENKPEDKEIIDIFKNNINVVKESNLKDIIEYIGKAK